MTPCYILKRTFTKVNLLNYPNNWGGAISQTGSPQNSISTSPSPITMTPCYILKRTFTKAQQFNWGGAISQTGLPQNSISTSPSPITMTPCYILKRTFTKVNLLNYPNNWGGGAISQTGSPQNSISTSHVVLYSKTNFNKSQPLRFPQHLRGGAITQTGLPQNSHLHFPPYNNVVLYFKTIFYKRQPPQFPQQLGGWLSHKPDYHKTPPPLLTMMSCYILKQTSTKVNLLNSPNKNPKISSLGDNNVAPLIFDQRLKKQNLQSKTNKQTKTQGLLVTS